MGPLQACKPVVVTYRTELYRAALTHNVDWHMRCLEVGCHTGTTTAMLTRRCGGRALGVDNVAAMVESARRRFPAARFELADGADIQALRALALACTSSSAPSSGSRSACSSVCASLGAHGGGDGEWDVIGVDLSGKAPLHVLLPVLAAYRRAWPAARLVVKNEQLYCAAEAAGGVQASGGAAPRAHAAGAGAELADALVTGLPACSGSSGGGGGEAADAATGLLLAELLPDVELFRNDGFLSIVDKAWSKSKDRTCRYCGQGGIGKWKTHNRSCAAKQAAKAAQRAAHAAAAAPEADRPQRRGDELDGTSTDDSGGGETL